MLALTSLLLALLLALPAPSSAQTLLFEPAPGQVLDSVPLYLGMPFEDALAALDSRFEVVVGPSETPHHAALRPKGAPTDDRRLNLLETDGRLSMIGSNWTPADPSGAALSRTLVDLLRLLSPSEAALREGLDCRVAERGGGAGGNLAIAEIACGRHMVHVVRYPGPGDAPRASVQLITR